MNWRQPQEWKSRLRSYLKRTRHRVLERSCRLLAALRKISSNLSPTPSVRSDQTQVSLGLMVVISLGVLTCVPIGCTNNLSGGAFSNSILASNPNSTNGGNSGNTGAFTLSQVLLNSLNPTTTLDLLDNGSGVFGSICLPTGSGASIGGSATSPTVCNCTFTYSSANNPDQSVDTAVIYHEASLLRCNYNSLPSDVTSFQVSVHLTTANTYSNPIRFSLNRTGALSPTDPNSYSLVSRYQCPDIVTIPYALDISSKIYDPFQSDNYHLSYPLDFYATNFANAIVGYVQNQSNNLNWNCPSILSASTYLTGNPLDSNSALGKFNAFNHINMKVYSKTPLSGSYLIYPPQPGVFDRSTFYLAKKSNGVFNVPINAYQSPGVITAVDGNNPPIGYGARTVSTGAGTETCPDTSIAIPSGYHWVKVWLFRASLPQRHYATSPDIANLAGISCNPGNFSGTNSPIFTQCTAAGAQLTLNSQLPSSTTDVLDALPGPYLADRVLDSGQCIVQRCGGASHLGGCLDGADHWKGEAGNAGCDLGGPDPLHICNSATKTPAIDGLPYTLNVSTQDIDTDTGRYDFLFVVSPPNINLNDMQNPTSNSPAMPYQPYRFFTDTDCQSTNPDQPTSPTDCQASNAINSYGLKLHDVGSAGDPAANDPNLAGVYPVCALQPN